MLLLQSQSIPCCFVFGFRYEAAAAHIQCSCQSHMCSLVLACDRLNGTQRADEPNGHRRMGPLIGSTSFNDIERYCRRPKNRIGFAGIACVQCSQPSTEIMPTTISTAALPMLGLAHENARNVFSHMNLKFVLFSKIYITLNGISVRARPPVRSSGHRFNRKRRSETINIIRFQ